MEKFLQIGLELLYRFGFSGVLYAVAFYYLQQTFEQGEGIPQAIIFGLLGSATLLASQFIKDLVEPIVEPFRQPITDFIISKIELGYVRLTSRFQKDYYRYVTAEHHSYRTQGLSKAPVTLELAKMFVPLRVVPQAYETISPKLIQPTQQAEDQTIWQYLAQSETQFAYRRIALIAPPGSGKTILLKHLALTYVQNIYRRYSRNAPRLIPVLLHLRDIQQTIRDQQPRLDRLIETYKPIAALKPPSDWFHQKLMGGHCLIMLDGLDEVSDADRQLVSRWIDRQIEQYRNSRFILTSRPLSFEGAPVREIDSYLQVKPFGFEQMETFLSNWYVQNAVAQTATSNATRAVRQQAHQKTTALMYRIRHNDALARLALNPLLLTMIATIDDYRQQELPLHRSSLYQTICDVLLVRRQEARGIDHSWADVTQRILQQLALRMMEEGTTELNLAAEEQQEFRATLHSTLGPQLNLEELCQQTDSASGLLVQTSPDTYSFVHLVFQEYFASVQVHITQQEAMLLDQLDDQWWSETIHLYAVQFDRANAVVEAAIARSTLVPLTVAHGLVQQDKVEASLCQQLDDTLETGLDSDKPEIFQLAAGVKLANRLTQLESFDQYTDIDSGYITQAEYQLFLDDQYVQANPEASCFYPDHWSQVRFQAGNAAQPIVGVRAKDAREFCRWLTQTQPSTNPLVTAEYRLPTVAHARNRPLPTEQQNRGYWCSQQGAFTIAGAGTRWQTMWNDNVSKRLENAIDRDRPIVYRLARTPDVPLRADSLKTTSQTLNNDNSLDLETAWLKSIGLELDHALKLSDGRQLTPTAHEACAALRRATTIIRNQLPKTKQILNRDRTVTPHRLDEVRAYLLVIASWWEILAEAYTQVSQSRQQLPWLPSPVARIATMPQERIISVCTAQRDEVMRLYRFFVLLDERRTEGLPAWEGIRLMRVVVDSTR